MPPRRLVLAGSVAAALTIRYLLPHPVADANERVAVAAPKRDPQVLREVLREVRQIEPVDDAVESDDNDDQTPAPELAVNEDGEPLDADGLTENERFESEVAVIEDRMQRKAGALAGVIKDDATGEPLAGVTVVATSPALDGTQTAITDERGFYMISELPPGDYLTTFYYVDTTIERSGLVVADHKTTPAFAKIDTRPINRGQFSSELIEIEGDAPVIDPSSTVQGITFTDDYIVNIPVPGRTFEAALGAAAGSQGDPTGEDGDGLGISFSGGTALENTYYIDGDGDGID